MVKTQEKDTRKELRKSRLGRAQWEGSKNSLSSTVVNEYLWNNNELRATLESVALRLLELKHQYL
jgi:hypothetical protein